MSSSSLCSNSVAVTTAKSAVECYARMNVPPNVGPNGVNVPGAWYAMDA